MPVPPTQLEIAKILGLSKTAVSLALSNSPRVSEATRRRVAEVAAEIGYKLNPYLRGFAIHQRRRRARQEALPLALLNLWNPPSAWKRSSSFREIQRGCVERAAELGYYIDEIELRAPGMTSRRANQILKTRGIRGLIVAPTEASHSHLQLDWKYFAAVAIGFTFRRPDVHRVGLNISLSIKVALRQLQRCRYRRVGLLLDRRFVKRMDGAPESTFLYYQKDLPASEQVPILWTTFDTFRDSMREWLERYRPSVILSYWEEVYLWLVENSYAVPRDIGYVLLNSAEIMSKKLGIQPSGINEGNRQTGAKAVEMVVGQLERNEHGIPSDPTVTLVNPRWIPGETIHTSPRDC